MTILPPPRTPVYCTNRGSAYPRLSLPSHHNLRSRVVASRMSSTHHHHVACIIASPPSAESVVRWITWAATEAARQTYRDSCDRALLLQPAGIEPCSSGGAKERGGREEGRRLFHLKKATRAWGTQSNMRAEGDHHFTRQAGCKQGGENRPTF